MFLVLFIWSWFFLLWCKTSTEKQLVNFRPDRADILAKSPPTPKGGAVEREY
jgi:hypothetical protein